MTALWPVCVCAVRCGKCGLANTLFVFSWLGECASTFLEWSYVFVYFLIYKLYTSCKSIIYPNGYVVNRLCMGCIAKKREGLLIYAEMWATCQIEVA